MGLFDQLGQQMLTPSQRILLKLKQQSETASDEKSPAAKPSLITLGGMEDTYTPTEAPKNKPVSMDAPQANIKGISEGEKGVAGTVGDVLGGIADSFTAPPIWTPNPSFDGYGGIGDEYIANAARGVKMFRYGGYLDDGEMGVVAEDTDKPELIRNRNGRVEVTPLNTPEKYGITQTEQGDDVPQSLSAVNELARIAQASKEGRRYIAPMEATGEGSGRAAQPTGSLLTLGSQDEEDIPLPPRQSYLDTARIIAENRRGGNPNDPGLLDARENVLKEQMWQLMNAPVKKSKWKDLLTKAAFIADNAINGAQHPIVGRGEINRQKELLPIAQKLGVIQAQKLERQKQIDADIENKLKQKRIEDYDRDEQFRREQLSQGALKQLVGLKYFDPNNPVHVALAQKAGRDPSELVGWDDRNPFTKKIGGREYVWDTNQKVFKPIDVPDNELVDYNVETLKPDGTKEIKTYKVPKIDAARFATQWGILGAQAEIADKRLEKTQAHSEKMVGIRAETEKRLGDYNRLQDEIKAEKDQKRKLALQANAAKLREDLVRAKKAIESNDEEFVWTDSKGNPLPVNPTGEGIPDNP